jgi:hypothetical protein
MKSRRLERAHQASVSLEIPAIMGAALLSPDCGALSRRFETV